MAESDGIEAADATVETVARYEKQIRIGEGAFGIVYLAIDRLTGEKVALKRLVKHRGCEDPLKSAKAEIRLLEKLKHPNIVEGKQVAWITGQSEDAFVVYEYCEHDLCYANQALKLPFRESEVKCILLQILQGLAHLHSLQMMHRDLKPANILYNKEGSIKICDVGSVTKFLSKAEHEATQEENEHTPNITTRYYSAPEMLLGSCKYSEKVDLWSVGCIFVELIKQEILFSGENELELLRMWTDLLGNPHLAWKRFKDLPGVKLLKSRGSKHDSFGKEIWEISELGQDLLRSLLNFDPEKRISAEKALKHAYFKEHPLPVSPFDLPQWPSLLESKARERKKALQELAIMTKKKLEKKEKVAKSLKQSNLESPSRKKRRKD